MSRLIVSVVLIFVSLALGYLWRRQILARQGQSQHLISLRDRLQFLAFFVFIPLSSMLSLWGLPTPDERLLLFPLLGLSAWTIGGLLGLVFAFLAHFSRAGTGSLFCCATFSNIGAVGTLVCVVFFGEISIAYVALYRLFEELFYYGLAIPVATRFKGNGACEVRVQGMRISRLLCLVIAALATGLILNRLHLPRPEVFGYLSAAMSILACVLALFSIGLGLRPSRLTGYKWACLFTMLIKFLLVPVVVTSLAYALGFAKIDAGLPVKIVLLLSSMPVAMNALLPPALLSLDLDMANACWLLSTLALALVLPVHAFCLLPLLSGL
ncbi:MAG: hypothetical protein K6G15_12015 [Desulfovibrio sp.]|nr:hypothetical protein [Desulfovibrio sp.]